MTTVVTVILRRKEINRSVNEKKEERRIKKGKSGKGQLVSPPNFVVCARHAWTYVHVREYTIAMWIQFLCHKRIAAKGSVRAAGREGRD